jgi:hypothetical protein
MSNPYHPASAASAALVLALCTGCDGAPRDRNAIPADGAATPAAARQGLAFDPQPPGSENQVPALEGTKGTLRYRPGCLYLDTGSGGKIGLVVPSDARFDGRRLIGKVTTPQGEPIVRAIGQFVGFSGALIENPRDGRYSCNTGKVLITDQF